MPSPSRKPFSRRAVLPGLALVLAAPALARAQGFPSKAIRFVVPYPAGGSIDALARMLAQELQAAKGWTVVVENKGGAAGAVGTREVAKAEPDGTTLVIGTNQTHATNAFLLKEPGYDPVTSFAPVAGLADLQHALVVPKASPATSLEEFVALARKQPGKLNYGSTGNGSASHLAMELFKAKAGIEMQHVAFRGAAPLSLELVAGRIDAGFSTLPTVVSLIESGELRALAVASDRRATQLASVPTLAEAGVRGCEADAWMALFAPARTPEDVLATLADATRTALAKPELIAAAGKQGIAINFRDRAAFAAFQTAEIAKWADVARLAKVVAE